MSGKSPFKSPLHQLWNSIEKLGPDDCWPWKLRRTARGYGIVQLRGRKATTAHRALYMEINGRLEKHQLVCHSCDNPCCCNPSHLWVGSYEDNMQDMLSKGRGKHKKSQAQMERLQHHFRAFVKMNPHYQTGENGPRAKLSNAEVVQIRKSRQSQTVLAQRYGVSQTTISAAKTGKYYKNV